LGFSKVQSRRIFGPQALVQWWAPSAMPAVGLGEQSITRVAHRSDILGLPRRIAKYSDPEIQWNWSPR